MNQNIRGILLVTAGMVAGAVISAGLAGPVPASKSTLPLDEIRQFTDVYGAVKQFYVEPVTDKKLMKEAISGMLHGLDPHSSFLDEEAFKELQEGTVGEFGGLGIEVSSDPAGVKVISPIDDTPAAQAGIRSGDTIYKINDRVIRGMPLSDAVKLMRGKPGTDITLGIVRKGEAAPLTLQLKRAIIKVQSVKHKMLNDGIGYIRISQFQERTASDVAKAIESMIRSGKLKNGLVLDLRNDPGGLLNAAVGVSAVFLPEGTSVVSTRGQASDQAKEFKATIKDYLSTRDDERIGKLPTHIKTIPMVVLVNGASASASEIVAGALQDHKRAAVLGTKTFGKGSVQTIIPLRGNDAKNAIKLTTARYFTPSGRSIQAKGIVPDVEVTDTATGNFLDFDIREADLANHLVQPEEQAKEAAPLPVKKPAAASGTEPAKEQKPEKKAPRKFYKFGEADDYQLNRAIEYLKAGKAPVFSVTGNKVMELDGGIRMKVEPIKN